MADDVRKSVLLTPLDLNGLRNSGADVTVLAVHSINPYTGQPSFKGQRIEGAVDTEAYSDFQSPPSVEGGQRPLPEIGVLQEKARRWGLRPESTIVIYDGDRSMTAARAWWVLKWAGLPDVRVLDGGFPAWVSAGLPTTDAITIVQPSTIGLSPGHMPVFDASDALRFGKEGILLDARIRPNYIGGPIAEGQPARGHIPRAISAPALDNVTDYGNFTDSATLREMYRALGVDGSCDVGVYCGAGMSAAHTVLALAAIGIPAAMYPGSWSAWVSDTTRPVITGADPF
ncbi:thiosulfate/3-mercaptopyruvate sulfurtransferase [Neorhizobium galegae]|uniref:sulfurtransferase n=1 Tax=Neorhizobium galegae TaxID=399 RepID=UPI001AE6C41C|nr:rhodanese-like domain-containing protein [Neorhizobium galegae]MBP2561867.1 thiosulfate/3-mercaptopyruvate sulfurtransferase [Neorhizobium galegae]MDQ0134870.1 thiosulfate/3-mercaptopyruvate sulfurtransferase [Neorhizobium galegae]